MNSFKHFMPQYASVIIAFAGLCLLIHADTHYVVKDNPGAQSPFTNWATAAANIQDAVNAASAGNLVLVSNGIYNTGGQIHGAHTLTNRVLITQAIILSAVSTNPSDTVIEGALDPGGINGNGPAAVRPIKATVMNVRINNFTIRNGRTHTEGDNTHNQSGGGIFTHWGSVSNCVIENCGASIQGGGFIYGTVYNSIIRSNAAASGGGIYNSSAFNTQILDNRAMSGRGGGIEYGNVVSNCLIAGNSAAGAGGGYGRYNHGGLIVDSVISNNSSASSGGGAYNTKLSHCLVVNNRANYGGGAHSCYATNTVFTGNYASNITSAVGGTTTANSYPLYNCLIYNNTSVSGYAVSYAYPLNCTVAGNTATVSGPAGFGKVWATNCVVYENRTVGGLSNFVDGVTVLKNSVIQPMPTGVSDGGGNNSDNPRFTDFNNADFRPATRSPCINAGITEAWMQDTLDLDGLPRVRDGIVDIGCYEYIPPPGGTIVKLK